MAPESTPERVAASIAEITARIREDVVSMRGSVTQSRQTIDEGRIALRRASDALAGLPRRSTPI